MRIHIVEECATRYKVEHDREAPDEGLD